MGNPYTKKGVPGAEEEYFDDDIVVTPQPTPKPNATQGAKNGVTYNDDYVSGRVKEESSLDNIPVVTPKPNATQTNVSTNVSTDGTSTSGANGSTTTTPQDDKSKAMGILDASYADTLKAYGGLVEKLEEEKRVAKENDAIARRREANMQMISSITDGLAGLANLIGVSKGASHINLQSSTAALDPKFEAARLQRRADMKDINTRLEQKANELAAIQERYGTAKANLQAKDDAEKAAGERFNKEMDFKQTSHDETMAFKWEEMRLNDEFRNKSLAETIKAREENIKLGKAQLGLQAKRLKQEMAKDMVGLTCGNSIVDIPKKNINNETIGAIYQLVEPEVKEAFFGNATDWLGNSQSGKPTLEQMLAMVGMASQGDSANAVAIQTKIKALSNNSESSGKKKKVDW